MEFLKQLFYALLRFIGSDTYGQSLHGIQSSNTTSKNTLTETGEETMIEDAVKLALPIIKEFEGCRLRAYQCPAGIWTIGYGQTKGIKQGMQWTQEQADADLEQSVRSYAEQVLEVCPELEYEPPYRLASCTSLAYNIGVNAFANSSVCSNTKKGEYEKASNSFLLWNKAGGKVLAGLVRRREAEKRLYEGV